MSRIGKKPIHIPSGVSVECEGLCCVVKGPLGTLDFTIPDNLEVENDGKVFQLKGDYQTNRDVRRVMGMARSIVQNMVEGVATGFIKRLQMVGVGYRCAVQGSVVDLSLGFSHPVHYQLPEGVSAEAPSNTELILKSHDKALVGQVAATIRAYRPPEPYQGKGVLYAGEVLVRKAGKTGKK